MIYIYIYRSSTAALIYHYMEYVELIFIYVIMYHALLKGFRRSKLSYKNILVIRSFMWTARLFYIISNASACYDRTSIINQIENLLVI